MGRMKITDQRQNQSEELGPPAKVGTSTLRPKDGGGKVQPPKASEPKKAPGPPLAFEVGEDGNTNATVTTTGLAPSSTPVVEPPADPPYSPIDAWCGACGSGLWQNVKTEQVACLFKAACPIALSGEKPIELTQDAAFAMLVEDRAVVNTDTGLDLESELNAIADRMDIDRSLARALLDAREKQQLEQLGLEHEQGTSPDTTEPEQKPAEQVTVELDFDAVPAQKPAEKPAEPVEPKQVPLNYGFRARETYEREVNPPEERHTDAILADIESRMPALVALVIQTSAVRIEIPALLCTSTGNLADIIRSLLPLLGK